MRKLTASALKTALWETLNRTKNGTIEVKQANAIAGQAREILRTVSTQLKISSQSDRETPKKVVDFSEA